MPRRHQQRHPFGIRTIQEFVEVPLRRPLSVLLPLILFFGFCVTTSFFLAKKYRSSTLILVESERVPATFVPNIATESSGQRLQTIRQEMLSRTRLERIISELAPYPANADSETPLSAQVEGMRRSIDIQTKGADAFLVEFTHTDPHKAMLVANRLATLFIEEAESQREQQTLEGFDFINSQLAESRKGLESREEAVRRFKEQNLGNLPEQLSSNLATLQRLQLEQQSLSEGVRAAQARTDLLRQSLLAPRMPGMIGGDRLAVLAELRGELAQLRTRYTDAHPDVQALLRRIQDLSGAGDPESLAGAEVESRRAEVKRAELELGELKAKQTDLEAQMRRLQARVDSAPRTEQQLSTLTRDYGQMQESYLVLLRKQLDAQVAEQMERRWKGQRFKVLDPAHLPDRAFFPNRTLFAFVGLMFGMLLGLATALAAEFLDHSVKNREQLEQLLSVPVLAAIPHISQRPLSGRSTS